MKKYKVTVELLLSDDEEAHPSEWFNEAIVACLETDKGELLTYANYEDIEEIA
jgi:hypothetical protein